ncbi:cytochrome P450, family 724, subfamily A, polypeptide 1 [Actinidia rufa]|uniref:Cytochrome P450 724B1 n=1 Tax=Actinidia rufa TaxID=165716 RepID=A0A7J0FG49_9ERIC|nr:cytochrome P450, family 724, subfamily A, polypeptide 1 [Actinidia rufa]
MGVGGFWFVMSLGLVGLVLGLGLVLNHFLPLFLNFGSHLPRGSFGWPLLGETLAFLKPHPSNSIGAFLQDHCSRNGKVFKSHLFFSPTVVSCDQELNYFILQNKDKLFQCSYPKPIHGILGDISMLVAVGDIHKRLRNVAVSLVTTIKSKPEFLSDMEKIAIHILESWRGRNQVLFCEEARKFTFNVIVKQVLGLTPDEPQTAEILQDFLTFMKGLISLPLYIPGTPYARAVQARRRLCCTVKAIIEERRRDASGKYSERNDFLEILLRVDSLSQDEKVSFVLDSLLGGYETTSVLMAMVVHFLAQSPTALAQLKLEHQTIREMKKEGELLNWEDYKKMDFTQNVITEALRYGNVVKFVHRKTLKDVKFRVILALGLKLVFMWTPQFCQGHGIHVDHESQGQTCKNFIPFGGGTRCCPGSELAKVEVAFFLHHLLQKFRWRTEDGDQPLAYPYVEFQKGLVLQVEPCTLGSSH